MLKSWSRKTIASKLSSHSVDLRKLKNQTCIYAHECRDTHVGNACCECCGNSREKYRLGGNVKITRLRRHASRHSLSNFVYDFTSFTSSLFFLILRTKLIVVVPKWERGEKVPSRKSNLVWFLSPSKRWLIGKQSRRGWFSCFVCFSKDSIRKLFSPFHSYRYITFITSVERQLCK